MRASFLWRVVQCLTTVCIVQRLFVAFVSLLSISFFFFYRYASFDEFLRRNSDVFSSEVVRRSATIKPRPKKRKSDACTVVLSAASIASASAVSGSVACTSLSAAIAVI